MNIPKDGLFGTLSQREMRLVMLGSCLTIIILAILPRGITMILLPFALLLLFVISLNQYNRVKAGEDPADRSQ
jgi:hypothetical protein